MRHAVSRSTRRGQLLASRGRGRRGDAARTSGGRKAWLFKLKGYTGGKSALYALVKEQRPERPRPVVRFEGLAGECDRPPSP
jgi:hypothetical protein